MIYELIKDKRTLESLNNKIHQLGGQRLIHLNDGKSLLTDIGASKLDIIFTDHTSDPTESKALISKIKKLKAWQQTPKVIGLLNSSSLSVYQLLNHGFDDYVHIPTDEHELADIIDYYRAV